MTDSNPQFLDRQGGEKVAYLLDGPESGDKAGLLWCGGFKSDMTGTKASELARWGEAAGRRVVRFDYFGHGASSGAFRDGTIGRWRDDALAVIDEVAQGPQVLVGSSMGGWIALLAALGRPRRVKGLVLIAPAPDFTEELMWKGFSDDIKHQLETTGVYRQPSEYDDEPYEITMNLIREGRNHLILNRPIPLDCPVRVLQGMEDLDVPWQHAVRMVEDLAATDVTITLVKHGDHRLSEPPDIARLGATLDEICALVDA